MQRAVRAKYIFKGFLSHLFLWSAAGFWFYTPAVSGNILAPLHWALMAVIENMPWKRSPHLRGIEHVKEKIKINPQQSAAWWQRQSGISTSPHSHFPPLAWYDKYSCLSHHGDHVIIYIWYNWTVHTLCFRSNVVRTNLSLARLLL